jgi:tetratricopeptide (TPR) repeat protein
MSVSLSNAFDELVGFCTLISSDNDKNEKFDFVEEFVRVDPLNPGRMVLRAKIEYRNDEENAMNDFDKAIELDPENPDWYEERALWYVDNSRFENEKIVKDFSRSITLDPQNPRRYWQRGEFGYSNWEGHFDDALADYNRAIELDPENPEWYSKRGDFFANRRNLEDGKEKAQSDYLKSVALEPDEAKWYVKLGDFYFDEGILDSAFLAYCKAIGIEPKKSAWYAKRAGVSFKREEFEAAIDDCNQGIDIDPEEPNCFLVRGLCHREKNDLADFEGDFIKVIDLSSSIHVFYFLFFAFIAKKTTKKLLVLRKSIVGKDLGFPIKSFCLLNPCWLLTVSRTVFCVKDCLRRLEVPIIFLVILRKPCLY